MAKRVSTMIIRTPPLATKKVAVFGALFKAQLPDTLNAIRQAVPDWVAAHVTMEGPPPRTGPTREQMRDEILAGLKPLAMLHDPIYTLTTPEIPPNTFATFVPDRVKPSFTSEYQDWKFVYYGDARAALGEFLEHALGGVPQGDIGVADALIKGKIKGQAVLEGWSGSLVIPSFKRTMEALIDPAGPVMFWDTVLGYETTGETFLNRAEFILGNLDGKQDRLYFDAANFSWFVVFNPGGEVRVGMIG